MRPGISWRPRESLAETWFQLGERTRMLCAARPLSEFDALASRKFGITAKILPRLAHEAVRFPEVASRRPLAA
jgi:hypothetical protein